MNLPISSLPFATSTNPNDLIPIVQAGITCSTTKNNLVPRFYGSWYDTKTQPNYAPNTSLAITADTEDFSYGITFSAGTITFLEAGIYNIQFSLQVSKTDAGSDTISIWLDKGNTPVPFTSTDITLQGLGASQVAAWNFFVNASAGDTYSLRWSSADSKAIIKAVAPQSSPTRPAIPSVILTISQIY
jgi:hypothetical protein